MSEFLRKRAGAKVLIVLLSIFLFLLLFSSSASAATPGDVNEDGEINVLDVVLVMQHVLEIDDPPLTAAQKTAADVNGDGVINVLDVTLLMQYALGIIDEFPAPDVLKAVSLSAINVKTIGVEFNRTPTSAEMTAVNFKVTKLTTTAVVSTVTTWDGKVAKLAREAGLEYTPGIYVVEVTGIDTAFTGTVTITAPTATSLEIRATSIPDDTEKVPLRVKLLDQYGEEMTLHPGAFTWTAMNLTTSVNVTDKISFDPVAKFVMDTTEPFKFIIGHEVQITFAHTPSTLSKTVVLPVTYKTQLASITFGDVILPGGATHLTKDLRDVRIPVTAKDQYGNDMFLVNGANVELFSSDQLIIENDALSFVTIDGKQHVNIAEFKDKGTVSITIMGTPGVVGSKSITVLESVPYELKVVTTPDSSIVEGKSTVVKFDVLDQFGNRITSDREFYEMRVVKTSGADVKISAPEHNYRYTIPEAIVDIPITAGTTLTPPYSETVTFRLQKTDNTYIDSETFSFTIVKDLDDLDVSVDKSEYTAGEDIHVTVKALLGGELHAGYNNVSGLATITLVDGTVNNSYIRTLTFVNGVATTTVPATLAADGIVLKVEYDGETGYSAAFDVKAAPASKFVLTGTTASPNLTVRLTDAYNNTIKTFEGTKLVRITFPNAATPPAGVTAEGDIFVDFAVGVGTIEFGANLVPGTYTVTHGGYTGSLTIPNP